MPVPVRTRLRALAHDVGGQARVARLLGVSASRVSRWLKTEEPDRENRRKVEGLEFVIARLFALYQRDTALKWLYGTNGFLANRRPVDVLAAGGVTEVIGAIDAEESLAYV